MDAEKGGISERLIVVGLKEGDSVESVLKECKAKLRVKGYSLGEWRYKLSDDPSITAPLARKRVEEMPETLMRYFVYVPFSYWSDALSELKNHPGVNYADQDVSFQDGGLNIDSVIPPPGNGLVEIVMITSPSFDYLSPCEESALYYEDELKKFLCKSSNGQWVAVTVKDDFTHFFTNKTADGLLNALCRIKNRECYFVTKITPDELRPEDRRIIDYINRSISE